MLLIVHCEEDGFKKLFSVGGIVRCRNDGINIQLGIRPPAGFNMHIIWFGKTSKSYNNCARWGAVIKNKFCPVNSDGPLLLKGCRSVKMYHHN